MVGDVEGAHAAQPAGTSAPEGGQVVRHCVTVGDIIKIGCDAIDDTIVVMKEGRVEATIAEPPFFLGKAILNTAYDYLEGKEIEPYVILENKLVTGENVDALVTKE